MIKNFQHATQVQKRRYDKDLKGISNFKVNKMCKDKDVYEVIIMSNKKTVHDKLCALWITWCKQNDMPEISANDLFYSNLLRDDDTSLTVKQVKFVEAFIVLWEIEND